MILYSECYFCGGEVTPSDEVVNLRNGCDAHIECSEKNDPDEELVE